MRRKYPPPQYKVEKGPDSVEKNYKNYVYELVENTITRKTKVTVILLKTLEGVGAVGNVMEMDSRRARLELLQGQAVYASPENLLKYKNLIEGVVKGEGLSSPFAKMTMNYIQKHLINVNMNIKKPWTLEKWHIRVAMRKIRIIVPDSAIILPPETLIGPDVERLENKEFYVTIKFNQMEEFPARCRLHHVASNPQERLPRRLNYYATPGEAIFPDQIPVLETLVKLYKFADVIESENYENLV